MKCLAHWNASLVSVVDGEHTVNQKGGALMDDSEIAKLADVLEEASRTGVPIEPLSTTFPTLDILSAYRVQGEGIRRRVGAGAVLKGHKVGLTSAAMQSQLGVDQPDAGCLLSDMFYPEREPVPVGSFIQPRVEPEIAFVLDAPLAGPGATVADAARAVGYVMGSIELIDSRIQDWQITIGDTIADNASCGGVVLGGTFRRLSEVDLALTAVVVRRNGLVVASGAGGAVMGTPLAALAWLANLLAERGESLSSGQVVLPGSLTVSVPASEGDTFEATFSGLGSVVVSFAGGDK